MYQPSGRTCPSGPRGRSSLGSILSKRGGEGLEEGVESGLVRGLEGVGVMRRCVMRRWVGYDETMYCEDVLRGVLSSESS